MESNSNDTYVLVLEDCTEVKNEQEAGKLSVVSSIDEKGNLKTTEAEATNQASFLKFNSKDGLLKNLDSLGLPRERLGQSGELEKLLNLQKSNLVTIAFPIGDNTIYTEARLAFRTDENGNIGLAVHSDNSRRFKEGQLAVNS